MNANERESGPGARTHALAVLAILAASCFLYSNTNSNLPVQGDDVFILTNTVLPGSTYLERMPVRGYLNRFYIAVFDLSGRDPIHTHSIFLSLHVVSSLLAWAALSRVFAPRAALMGALASVAYSGKYEAYTWISAGGYLVVLCVFWISVWIAVHAGWSPWTKGLTIAAINWPAVHLYEVLISVAPLYPLAWWVHARLRGRAVRFRDVVPLLMPMLMFLIHVGLMYWFAINGLPLWKQRGAADSLVESLPRVLVSSVSGLFGLDHIHLVHATLLGWFLLTPWREALIWGGLAGAVVVLCWHRLPTRSAPHREVVAVAGEVAVWVVLVAPLVSVAANTIGTPSRLLVIPSTGIVTAAALMVALWPRTAWIVALAIAMEAVTAYSLLDQHRRSWEYDARILAGVVATSVPLTNTDRVTVAMPWDQRAGRLRRYSPSQFESGAARVLLEAQFGMIPDHPGLRYRSVLYWAGSPLILDAAVGEQKLFLVDPEARVCAVRALEVVDADDAILDRRTVAPGGCVARVEALWFDAPFVLDRRKLQFNAFRPASRLVIHGDVLRRGRFEVEIRQGSRSLGRRAVSHGPFDWTVPLDGIDPSQPLELVNHALEGEAVWEIRSAKLTLRR